jgi:hypothetical protein
MRSILLAAGIACLATPALAEESRNCGTIDEVRTMLTDKYHEAVVAHGVAAEGQVLMTVFASPDGATWSIVMTRARDGMACITGEGTDYEVRQPEPDQGEGS